MIDFDVDGDGKITAEAAIKGMSSSQYAASSAKKRKDTAAGKQFSKQPKAAAKTSRRYRRS